MARNKYSIGETLWYTFDLESPTGHPRMSVCSGRVTAVEAYPTNHGEKFVYKLFNMGKTVFVDEHKLEVSRYDAAHRVISTDPVYTDVWAKLKPEATAYDAYNTEEWV